VRDGKLRSFHTVEIPLIFENVDSAKSMVGSGQDADALADRISSAWVAFARTGNPNTKLTPYWEPFNTKKRAVMVINNDWKLVNDPHGEEQRLLRSMQSSAG